MSSDSVFALDVFQSDKDNSERVLCPAGKEHGPMFSSAGAAKFLCNDLRCKMEAPIPNAVVRAALKRLGR